MLDYLAYMLTYTLSAIALLFVFGIMRFKLQKKLWKMLPFVFGLAIPGYIATEIGVCTLKPWFFDCSRTIGFCPCGLPVEDFLFAMLVTLAITLAALTFSEMERRSKSTKEFLEYLFLLRWN